MNDARIRSKASMVATAESPSLTRGGTLEKIRTRVSNHWTQVVADRAMLRRQLGLLVELGLLFIWALLLALPYLRFDPKFYPGGVDYFLQVHFNHVWTRALECGMCAMWNGNTGGGNPAFADIFPSTLHPLTILTTLGWGVRNGGKVELLLIFFMAGFAQWWLARVIGVGIVARMWSSAMAIVAGNVVGRMDMGWINVALSTVACALILPPLIRVGLTGSRRAAILLGVVLGMAALAGQGYMQLGFLMTTPAALILLPWGKPEFRLVIKRYALAIGLGFLLSAPFILPFATAYPYFGKAEDVDFRGAIHFLYMPLGFVLNDPKFFRSHELGMQGFAALYVNYIGWLPILLGLFAIRFVRDSLKVRVLWFLLAVAVLAIFASSIEPRAWLSQTFPGSLLESIAQRIRSAPVIAGLAVTPLLGIAAMGLDELWHKFSGTLRVGLETSPERARGVAFNANWLLVIPLVWSLMDVRAATTEWIRTEEQRPETYPVLRALQTSDTQWVYFPTQNFYLEPAIAMGLKIPWYGLAEYWKNRDLPPAYRVADLNVGPSNMKEIRRVRGVHIYEGGTENSYALVENDAGEQFPCAANARAGDIDLQCNLASGGTLTVNENSWAGWYAYLDGHPLAINSGRWLSVDVPQGEHLVQFRYRPWDFPLGVLLFFIGIGLCIFLWRKPDEFAIVPTE